MNSAVHSVAVLTPLQLVAGLGAECGHVGGSTGSEDVGLADRRAEVGAQEVEVAALVGLPDVRENIQP